MIDSRVVIASREKTALICVGSIVLATIGGWFVKEHSNPKELIAGWAGFGCASVTGVLSALQLVWPPRLVLDGDGLAFRYLSATFNRRWVDVRQIDVVQFETTKIVKLVANPGGRDLSLGGAWPISADELVSLIEEYRARIGRGGTGDLPKP